MAQHVLTTRNYTSVDTNFSLSAACREGGDGQCDGWLGNDWAASDECGCSCHRGGYPWDNALTVAAMEQAHADMHYTGAPRALRGAHRRNA